MAMAAKKSAERKDDWFDALEVDLQRKKEEVSHDLVVERGEAAAGALMGLAMERLRGRADGRLVSEVLRERLRRATANRK